MAKEFNIRRVVTGHTADGKAMVAIDEISKNVVTKRPGQTSTVIWATNQLVPDMGPLGDISANVEKTTVENGSVFRIGRFEPGVAARVHRTASIDYAIVLSGAIDMELDDGKVAHLKAGDMVVQRGTVHNWVNHGPEDCMIAFILVHAKLPEGLEPTG
jgi:quercetin dioxygenase-like cupin family protein